MIELDWTNNVVVNANADLEALRALGFEVVDGEILGFDGSDEDLEEVLQEIAHLIEPGQEWKFFSEEDREGKYYDLCI